MGLGETAEKPIWHVHSWPRWIRYFLLPLLGVVLLVALPHLFPDRVTFLADLWAMIIFALTWDVVGGQMGYNSFGNIFFFGVGMYVCAIVQKEMLETAGESADYFLALGLGAGLGALVCIVLAALLGSVILGMRGHYFAVCTLGLGVAGAEIAAGIDYIGAGSGMSVPLYPIDAGNQERFFYYCFLVLALGALFFFRRLYAGRFGLVLNAIRDDEEKAESMGLRTTLHKTFAWMSAACFLGLLGAGIGNQSGYIDPRDVAFPASTFGIYMILAVLMGGRGTLWGPVLGSFVFHVAKEFFWTEFLGWNRVALGLLILFVVVFAPGGILGWVQDRRRRLDEEEVEHPPDGEGGVSFAQGGAQ